MIKVEGLTKIFNFEKNNVIALQDISFKIEKGDIYSIIGKTGSGKSTLLNLLLGVIAPTSGKIVLNNDINSCCNFVHNLMIEKFADISYYK